METKKTPPAYGLSGGPMIVACQWNMSSATGPTTRKKKTLHTRLKSLHQTHNHINRDISAGPTTTKTLQIRLK